MGGQEEREGRRAGLVQTPGRPMVLFKSVYIISALMENELITKGDELSR